MYKRQFAASITSSSRIDPPGCTTLEIPISFDVSMLSRNGKKASETIIAPLALSPALLEAIRTASTRLVCPGPMPTVAKPEPVLLTRMIALDWTSAMTEIPNLASLRPSASRDLVVTERAFSQSMLGGPWA